MSDQPLPFRPRLADFALLRRHVIDGVERAAIHDTRSESAHEIEVEALELIRCADGTRDIAGVMLEAARRGLYRRASAITMLFSQLSERGLLVDGIARTDRSQEPAASLPLEVLPGFGLHCDANGSCCTTYSAVQFTETEARRARALVPDVLDRSEHEQLFLPVHGSAATKLSVVTMVDGGCAYLADDGLCQVQMATGDPEAKPGGCNIFPSSFVADNVAVRVSLTVECACVLASVGRQGGSPLVPEGANSEADLLPLSRVIRLAESIEIAPGVTAPLAALRPWSDAVLAALDGVDPIALVWSLAEAIGEQGLTVGGVERAVANPTPATVAELSRKFQGLRMLALAGKTRSKRESAASWRSTKDRTRRLSAWLDEAAQALLEPAVVTRLLAQAPMIEQERFYVQAAVFGHRLVGDLPLTLALKDRATRLLLARQMAACVPDGFQDPSVAFPITAVEAMMRGQGLAGYATGLAS